MPYPWEQDNFFNNDWNQASYTPDTDWGVLSDMLLANWVRESQQAHTGPGNAPGLSSSFTRRMANQSNDLRNEFLLQKMLGNAAFADDNQWDTRLGEQYQASARQNRRIQDVGRWGSGQRALNRFANQLDGTRTAATSDWLAGPAAAQKDLVSNAVLSGTNPMLAQGRQARINSAFNVWQSLPEGTGPGQNMGNFVTYARSLGLLA